MVVERMLSGPPSGIEAGERSEVCSDLFLVQMISVDYLLFEAGNYQSLQLGKQYWLAC
jgi:hypothetical protein